MTKDLIDKNPVLKHSIEFSLLTIKYCELLSEQKKFVISKQLLRSSTSIGANIIESQNSESKADFIHKLKIASKEADETQYWLILCDFSTDYPDCRNLFNKLTKIQKLLNSILKTVKTKSPISYLMSFLIF